MTKKTKIERAHFGADRDVGRPGWLAGWALARGDLRVGDIAWDRAATAPTGAARSEPLARAQHRSV
eukprot:scaffold5662_cov149-Isochrysis_galbana.AAC.1